VILWIREQSESEHCQDLNYNKGGAGALPPNAVATCGGAAWFETARRKQCRRESRRRASGLMSGPQGCAGPGRRRVPSSLKYEKKKVGPWRRQLNELGGVTEAAGLRPVRGTRARI
jgi:hypothetical protein